MEKAIVKILVCCHKPGFYLDNEIYMPIHCGKAISKDFGIQGDDTGDNISRKNGSYCELTALYWAWKNLKNVDFIGMCHYRRYFNLNEKPFLSYEADYVSEQNILKLIDSNILDIISSYDVILPASRPFSKSLIDTHIQNHGFMSFCILERVILKLYPEYKDSLYHVFYHMSDLPQRNMFIMKREVFDCYSEWLFSILFEVEKHVKLSGYIYEQRLFGFMGEMLLPLFFYHNKLKAKRKRLYFIMNEKNETAMGLIARSIINKLRFYLNTCTIKKIYSDARSKLLEQENISI